MSEQPRPLGLEEPDQLIFYIVRHQAALGLESRELEPLVHLALHCASTPTTSFLEIEWRLSRELGKTRRQVRNALARLKYRGFVTTRSPRNLDGSRPIPWYDLAPLKAMIVKLEEGLVTHDE